ncbi:hypothetical protein [Streptomyces sasae]|uniref:hypothetical protein n=1 Tax=Streptomyces sasae TaxID=1266772 RepID=UPI00292E5338|nr:hypothetical protein [Streptomyces sasae]
MTSDSRMESTHWWIRLGTSDSDTSHVISANLAARLDNLGDFITWIADVTSFCKDKKGKRN